MTSPTDPVPVAPPERHHAPVGRIILVVVGSILVLIGIGIGGAGGFLTWAYATQRDSDGYFTTGDGRFETVSYAVTSEDLDLGAGPAVDLGDLATVRLDVESASDQGVFVGIGPRDDVDRYLRGVAHAEVDDVQFDPFEVTYRRAEGGRSPEPPGRADFWAASAEGRGRQSLEWDLESGRWSVVLMNADGSAGVAATVSAGVTAGWVLPVAIGLLVFGGLLLLGGAVMLAFGAAGLAHHDVPGAVTRAPAGEPPSASASPVRLEGRPEPLSRWLWLVKWILVIPHIVVLVLLWVAFAVLSVVAWFAILFTGRYPQGIFDFNVGVLRWSWRVGYYSFAAFGTDRYPPFSLRPDAEHPATLEIARPERLSRGLVLVKSWLLAIPHLVVVAVILGGGGGWENDAGVARWPGLLPVLLVVAVVALLFTGRYPGGLFNLVMGLNRWVYRVIAYVALMTDEYPPFRLDQGGTEPVLDEGSAPMEARP